MRKFFLLALPLASLMMCVGCNESQYSSSGYNSTSSRTTTTASTQARPAASTTTTTTTTATTTAPVPQQTTYSRSSTTQPLPSGWGYMHEADLTGGRLPATASSQTTRVGSGI